MRCPLFVGALAAVLLIAHELPAQNAGDPVSAFAPRPALSLSAGISQFDLAGTGTMNVAAIRGELPLLPALLLEGGVTLARPLQYFGRSTLVMPELQLQLQLPRRVAPYFGLGAGYSRDYVAGGLSGATLSRATFSGSAGLRAAITRQFGLRAELRIREFGTGFNGTTADWTLGTAWRF